MNNINTMLTEATETYMNSEKLKGFIELQAEQMVNNAVKDAFNWSGNIKKQIDDVIKNKLAINIEELNISGQNKFITEIVTKKLKQYVRNDVEKEISKSLEDILKPIEKVVSIDTLQKKLIEAADTSDVMCGCDVDMDYVLEHHGLNEIVTFIAEEPGGNYGWVTLYFDKEPNKSTYECEFELTVHKNSTSFKVREREIKATDKIMNPFIWDIEDFIYCMFLNNSTINYEEAKTCV